MNEELTNYMKSSKSTPKGKNMPSTMRTIIWITQSENTVKFFKIPLPFVFDSLTFNFGKALRNENKYRILFI